VESGSACPLPFGRAAVPPQALTPSPTHPLSLASATAPCPAAPQSALLLRPPPPPLSSLPPPAPLLIHLSRSPPPPDLARAAASLVARTIGACRGSSRRSKRGGSRQHRWGFLPAAARVPLARIADGVQPPPTMAHTLPAATTRGPRPSAVVSSLLLPSPLPAAVSAHVGSPRPPTRKCFLRAALSVARMPSRCSAQCRQDHLT